MSFVLQPVTGRRPLHLSITAAIQLIRAFQIQQREMRANDLTVLVAVVRSNFAVLGRRYKILVAGRNDVLPAGHEYKPCKIR
jgi:hypothetical protein